MKQVEYKTISLILSSIALVIAFTMNIVLLEKNIRVSYLGQYGNYSKMLHEYDYEIIIPVLVGLTALLFGLLSKRRQERKGTFCFQFSFIAIVLSVIPTWKLFFEFMRLY